MLNNLDSSSVVLSHENSAADESSCFWKLPQGALSFKEPELICPPLRCCHVDLPEEEQWKVHFWSWYKINKKIPTQKRTLIINLIISLTTLLLSLLELTVFFLKCGSIISLKSSRTMYWLCGAIKHVVHKWYRSFCSAFQWENLSVTLWFPVWVFSPIENERHSLSRTVSLM